MKATKKQKDAFKGILKGKSVSAAMKDAKYKDTTAHNPKNLTGSKAYQEFLLLLNKKITDQLLINRLQGIIKEGANREALTGIDMGLKLKERYPKDSTELDTGDVKVIIRK